MSAPQPLAAGRGRTAAQRGLSLVELMVAAALGLLVVAAALKLLASQVDGSRRLLLEARLNQDLRSAADLVARDLRRAGYWPDATPALRTPSRLNPYAAATPVPTAGDSVALYAYARDAVDTIAATEAFGVRLTGSALRALHGGSWQELTDPGSLTITRFTITPHTRELSLGHLCEPVCPASEPTCPRLLLRHYAIEIAGQATTDPRLRREIHESVRLRNDSWPVGACPGATP